MERAQARGIDRRLGDLTAHVEAHTETQQGPTLGEHEHAALLASYAERVAVGGPDALDAAERMGAILSPTPGILAFIASREDRDEIEPDPVFWQAVGGRPTAHNPVDPGYWQNLKMPTAEEVGCPPEWHASMARLDRQSEAREAHREALRADLSLYMAPDDIAALDRLGGLS